MASTGNRDLDLALMTAFQTCAWGLRQTCRETLAKIEVFRRELLVNGVAGLTPALAPDSPIPSAAASPDAPQP